MRAGVRVHLACAVGRCNGGYVLEACDRVSMIQEGEIALDKPTAETSGGGAHRDRLNEYRRARLAAQG